MEYSSMAQELKDFIDRVDSLVDDYQNMKLRLKYLESRNEELESLLNGLRNALKSSPSEPNDVISKDDQGVIRSWSVAEDKTLLEIYNKHFNGRFASSKWLDEAKDKLPGRTKIAISVRGSVLRKQGRKRNIDSEMSWRERKAVLGLCNRCGKNPPRPGLKSCESCGEKIHNYNQRHPIERKRLYIVCQYCGIELMGKQQKWCDECAIKVRIERELIKQARETQMRRDKSWMEDARREFMESYEEDRKGDAS